MIEREHRAVFSAQLQRRRGRPRSNVPKVSTRIELSAPAFDALCREAHERRVSLHALLKRKLESGL